MEPLKNPERKISKTVFGIIAGLAGLLVCLSLVYRQTKQTVEEPQPLVVMQPVTLPDAFAKNDDNSLTGVLRQRLFDLQQLQHLYNTGVTSGKEKEDLEKLRTSVMLAEEAFRSSIDSIWISAIADKNTDSLQLKTIAAYRSSLDSIRTVNSNLTAATSSEDFVPDREAFIKLRNELMEKTNKIALLESSIELMSKKNSSNENSGKAGPSVGSDAEVQNTLLLESKVEELTAGNQRLQQEIERLKKLSAEIPKNSNAEQLLVSKNTALQQKVNAINAELQLVRVDCNLSRADATQIISNSKQRKQLLSEASSILTDLSTSSDVDIRSKVKEKIVRLNQVAANTRD